MKRELYEVWKENEGSKIVWKVQCPKGRLTFQTKKNAEKFRQDMLKVHNVDTIKLY